MSDKRPKIRCNSCGRVNILDFHPNETKTTIFNNRKVKEHTGLNKLAVMPCEHCGKLVTNQGKMEMSDNSVIGFCYLVQALVSDAMNPPTPSKFRDLQECNRIRKVNRSMIYNNLVVHYYAEAFGYDEQRIKHAILRVNQELATNRRSS